MESRFYLQALGITALFILLMVLFWNVSEPPASEEAVQSANRTRTALAMTGSYLLEPRTNTPPSPQTSVPGSTSTIPAVPSPTSTSLLPQLNTPIAPVVVSITPFPTRTPLAQVPVFTITASSGLLGTKAPPFVAPSETPTTSASQDPAEFARWYFTRVWNERDYQNLWENYLTTSYKSNVGSGLFEDYIGWWDSVERVDVLEAEALVNNGRDAWVRVNLSFQMRDGRTVENQVYDYDFLYDPIRQTWMFDAS